jgi:hypothetical protein
MLHGSEMYFHIREPYRCQLSYFSLQNLFAIGDLDRYPGEWIG